MMYAPNEEINIFGPILSRAMSILNRSALNVDTLLKVWSARVRLIFRLLRSGTIVWYACDDKRYRRHGQPKSLLSILKHSSYSRSHTFAVEVCE